MTDLKEFIDEAHKSADKAISKVQRSAKWSKFKDWMNETITIKRIYFASVYFALFGFIMYEIIIY